MPKHVSISAICTATESRSTDESEHFNTSALDGIGALGVEGGRGVGELAWGAGCLGLPDGGDVIGVNDWPEPEPWLSRGRATVARAGNEPSRARLGSVWLGAWTSSARLGYFTSWRKRLGSARPWLASWLGSAREPYSGIYRCII
jgi:hypothetical protein